MMRLGRSALARGLGLLVAVAMLAGCGGGGTTSTPGSSASVVPRGQWTIMVYMSGSNDLESKVAANLNLMEQVAQSDQVRIVVQCKTLKDTLIPTEGGTTTAKRFQVMHDDDPARVTSPLTSPALEDRGNASMDDAAELASFVKWADDRFPAQHHMLVMWDHAGSFSGFGGDVAAQGSGMSFPATLAALQEIQRTTSIGTWDIIGWDACMMASLEVDVALAPFARYGVASEELSPGQGWAYDRFLGSLVGNPAMGAVDVGRTVVDSTIPVWAAAQEEDVTLSVVDLSATSAVADAINRLGATLQAYLPGGMTSSVLPRRMQTMIFGKQKAIETGDFVDIGSLCTQLGGDPALFSAANGVLQVLGPGTGVTGQGAVVYRRSGPRSVGATGLQVHFPNVSPLIPAFGTTVLASPAAWGNFLVAYQAALAPLAAQVPTVTLDFASAQASTASPAVVTFTTAPSAVGIYNQTLEIGEIVDATHVDIIGVTDLNRQQAGQCTTSWDSTVLTLADGTSTVPLGARPDQPGSRTWQADVWYRPAGEEEVKGLAVFTQQDDGTMVFAGVAGFNAEGLPSKPSLPAEGDEITPRYTRVDLTDGSTADGREGTTLTVPAGGLTLAFQAVTGGGRTYKVMAWAQTYAEARGFAHATVTVP